MTAAATTFSVFSGSIALRMEPPSKGPILFRWVSKLRPIPHSRRSFRSDNRLGGTQARVSGLQNIPYKAILFRPDGSTHSESGRSSANEPLWTLTVVRSIDASLSESELPDNFATVVCDPVTGRSALYRP